MMKKYRLNERGQIQLAALGLTVAIVASTYTTIYATAHFVKVEEPAEPKAVVVEYEAPEEPSKPEGVEEMIQLACEEYGIDHEIPLAIAKLETGHFTSRAYTEGNNVGGLSVDEVPLEYDSLDEGVDAFVGNLAENYFAEGLTTPEEIGKKYCPVNEQWAEIVNEIMKMEI